MRLNTDEINEEKLTIIIEEDDVNKLMYDFNNFYKSIEKSTAINYVVDASKIDYAPMDFLSILVKIHDVCKKNDKLPTIRAKINSPFYKLLNTAQFNNLYNIEGV